MCVVESADGKQTSAATVEQFIMAPVTYICEEHIADGFGPFPQLQSGCQVPMIVRIRRSGKKHKHMPRNLGRFFSALSHCALERLVCEMPIENASL